MFSHGFLHKTTTTAHIFFDDAMKLSADGKAVPNAFVSTFMDCVDDAIRSVCILIA